MKNFVKKTRGLIRGTSTAVVLSVAIHAALFFAAGVWVVFKFIDTQEVKFVPQKIERPKMKLKKLRVKVKDQAKPRKTTQRISSSRKSAVLPPIQLPEMSGMGAGLEGSIGGFEVMADIENMSIMGAGQSVGNDFEGKFYDLKRYKDGTPVPGMTTAVGYNSTPPFTDAVNKFLANNWSPSTLEEYYSPPQKLYATHFMIPPMSSAIAPDLFGIDSGVEAALWVIHYKGKIAHKKGGKFRFWGYGDDVFFVRMNKKIILNAGTDYLDEIKGPDEWQESDEGLKLKKIVGLSRCRVGDWFTLKPNEPVDMEVLMGEVPGGWFQMTLLVEEFGVEYPENDQGTPIFPVFKTMSLPPHIIDEIKYLLVPGEADLESGPIFSVH